jgi:superoxide dismutase, Cu-Zn family
MGDLPNLYAHTNGSAGMEFFSDLFSLNDLRDDDGAALIMHQNRDDHISQPMGGVGPRVGCAVLE